MSIRINRTIFGVKKPEQTAYGAYRTNELDKHVGNGFKTGTVEVCRHGSTDVNSTYQTYFTPTVLNRSLLYNSNKSVNKKK